MGTFVLKYAYFHMALVLDSSPTRTRLSVSVTLPRQEDSGLCRTQALDIFSSVTVSIAYGFYSTVIRASLLATVSSLLLLVVKEQPENKMGQAGEKGSCLLVQWLSLPVLLSWGCVHSSGQHLQARTQTLLRFGSAYFKFLFSMFCRIKGVL